MKTKILQLILSCIILPIFGQYKYLDIPKLDNNDLKSAVYSKNPSEAAEILYKSYHYYITDGELNLDVVSRVKIYKKDQAEKFLNQEIYTYDGKNNKSERVTSLKVLTYNFVNDKVETTTVEKNSKYKSKESKNYTVTKFAFENVKDGSIIEYKYSVLSPYVSSVDKITVEDNVPTRRFDYVLDFPKYLGFNIDYKGSLIPKNRDVADKNIYGGDYYTYRFGFENIAPYRDEKYVHNLDNYRTSIRAELNSTNIIRSDAAVPGNITTGGFKSYAITWTDICKQLYESDNFGDQLKKKSLVKDLLPADIKNITIQEERAAAILKFVQKNYTWNNYYTIGAEDGKGIKNLLETKVGSSGEINLLMILLMRNAGLDAQPVVLSTIGRGILLDYSPSINQLNYVLASLEIGGKFIVYDATSKMTVPNLIRPVALNYKGYVMNGKEAKRVNIFCPEKSTTYLTVDAKLNPDGTVAGSFSDKDTKLYAMMNNEKYDQDKAAYQKESYKDRYTFPFTNIKTELLENNDFQTSFDFDSDTFVDGIGGKLVFNPLLFLYNKSHQFDQPDERKSPIELYTGYDKIKKVTITLPDGYGFENVPKSKKFRTEDSAIQYVYKVTQEGNKLTIETTTTVEDPVYPKEYYPAFKQIFDNITKMEGQVVTAVKK